MRKPDGQTMFLGTAILASLVLVAYLLEFHQDGNGQQRRNDRPTKRLDEIPFDGQAAFQWIEKLCAIGPRPSGSSGMQQQQQLLMEHFKQLGGEVALQPFTARHPLTGETVEMANLIVRWHADRSKRILLCAHYDTRPFPDQDPNPRQGVFVGANDGASGVAVLAELGRQMPSLTGEVGVDFCLFDGEELVFEEKGDYFLGSTHFARAYAAEKREYAYRCAVLLDMVGDAHLELYQDISSLRWRDTKPFVQQIWRTAGQLGVGEFIPRRMRVEIRDDHLALHQIGQIPALDIIDFDYVRPGENRSFWHTSEDTPDKCSAESLAKVGWVLQEWLKQQR